MSPTIKSLGLDQLSPAERICLAGELWDSVTATPGVSLLSDAHREDWRRRLEQYRDNPLAGSPWDEVKARLLGGGYVSLPVIVNPSEEADLIAGYAWCERRRAGQGADFLLCVEEAVARIGRQPELYAPEIKELRLATLRRYQFAATYRIDAAQVTVVAVYHLGSDPRTWQSRA